MQHFFVTPSDVGEGRIYIEGSDVNHMRNVLRMRRGEELTVSDGIRLKYRCAIEGYEEDRAVLQILEEMSLDTELSSEIYLFQGLPKQDKMELIVKKAVELGVYQVIPMETRRSVVRLDAKKALKKAERWQEIARSAAKQAGRGLIPKAGPVMSYEEALKFAGNLDVLLLPYELEKDMKETKKIIEAIRPGQSIALFIGPEGGFEKEEVDMALGYGFRTITLGRRILRTETAGLTALSILTYHLEE